jgi:hypothetical protein
VGATGYVRLSILAIMILTKRKLMVAAAGCAAGAGSRSAGMAVAMGSGQLAHLQMTRARYFVVKPAADIMRRKTSARRSRGRRRWPPRSAPASRHGTTMFDCGAENGPPSVITLAGCNLAAEDVLRPRRIGEDEWNAEQRAYQREA